MNIVYKKYGEREETDSITTIIDQSDSYYSGQIERIGEKLYNSCRVTEKLIDILYKKGVLNNEDIKELVSTLIYIDEDSEIKISLK